MLKFCYLLHQTMFLGWTMILVFSSTISPIPCSSEEWSVEHWSMPFQEWFMVKRNKYQAETWLRKQWWHSSSRINPEERQQSINPSIHQNTYRTRIFDLSEPCWDNRTTSSFWRETKNSFLRKEESSAKNAHQSLGSSRDTGKPQNQKSSICLFLSTLSFVVKILPRKPDTS